ncbi:DNA topology modulation protein [Paenibacillus donghaensis]|uniref:AAA family ATPase n=1 Tax=Paenibacillus donghaensis TaxID=414771 RepID=A0A2Z2KQ75_9BACL|nr:DNA topology modulation protein [Paenibacillus donghaensis]ASA22451.1 AAA family ATPase [Paenibacillus donghaensis]
MKRILVIGSGGTGKSTLSGKLGTIVELPVVHLDSYFWKANWVPTPNEEWDQRIEQWTNEDRWIIDGNYSRTMDARIKRADVIIFLDLPRLLCMYRIIKRRVIYHKKSRPDMNGECAEKLDWEFIKWVWNYRKRSRMNTLRKLDQAKDHQQVIILRTRKQVAEFVQSLVSSQRMEEYDRARNGGNHP